MTNLSAKELSALEDQLTSEQLLVTKYRTFSQNATDEVLKTKFNEIADKHQQHFNCLMNYLQ